MDKIKEILQTKFTDEFSYFKTQEVVYDANEMTCCISFLYPENVSIENIDREKLINYIKEFLNLKAEISFKFKKSFLDKDLIIKEIQYFFKKFHYSMYNNILKENIAINRQDFNVEVVINVPKDFYDLIDHKELSTEIKVFLEKNFCADFNILFGQKGELDFSDITEQNLKVLQGRVNQHFIVPRYAVYDLSIIVGKEIPPNPEFLTDIKKPKQEAILAGKIENLTKKSYVKIRNGKEVEKFYYRFFLNEGKRRISAIYFCPKSNIEKMDILKDEDTIVIMADIEKDGEYLTAKIKSISLCEIDEKSKKKHTKERIPKIIEPVKYNILSQGDLFYKKTEYSDFITNNVIVVYDLETTGLDADLDEIIEIGAVKIENGNIVEHFSTLVKPKFPIPTQITKITSIDDDMVKDAPHAIDAINSFYKFAEGCVLAGYNSLNFDDKFILKAYQNYGLNFTYKTEDVMLIAKEKVESKNYKLATIVKKLNIKPREAHRALNDAFMTADILLELNKK